MNDAKPLAAVAPKDAAASTPAPQSGEATTPATPPAQATPAKPAPAQAKPTTKPSTPSGGQAPVQAAKQCRVLLSKSGNTTTWQRCTGQMHHAISKTIHKALEKHQNLRGVYKVRDDRFVTQAVDEAAHNGYQKWHIALDKEIATFIDANEALTPATFETYLRQRYAKSDLKAAFPNGL